jgi:hypothetical protein
LSQLANIEQTFGPGSIRREAGFACPPDFLFVRTPFTAKVDKP